MTQYRLTFLQFVILFGFLNPVLAGTLQAPSLFDANVTSLAPALPAIGATNKQSSIIKLNKNIVTQLRSGKLNAITVNYLGKDIVFNRSHSKAVRNVFNWSGKNAAENIEINLTIGNDHLFGKIIGLDKEVEFKPGGNSFEIYQSILDPNKEIELASDGLIMPIAPVVTTAPAISAIAPMTSAAENDGTRIDVMVLYTDGMAAAYPGTAIDTRIQYLIDQANQAYTNSNINTQLNLVYSKKVNYVDDSPGGMSEALNDLTNNNGVFSGIESDRGTYGADQVTLLRTFVDEGCGLAWVIKNNGSAAYSYSVVHDGSKTDGSGYYCSNLTYAHELGHNLGSAHDRLNAGVSGIYDYSYGYQDTVNSFYTVMAYSCAGCQRITNFSNPNVNYQGNPTGIADPDPNSADNAKSISLRRVEMAAYRAEVNHKNEVLKRAELSKEILQAKFGTSHIPPAATGSVYTDVQVGDFNADWIEELSSLGITEGCDATRYCPDMAVTKEQLALILLKAEHGSAYVPPAATGTVFNDVSTTTFAADWIEQLKTEGITEGCDANNYCPKESLTQGGFNQMLYQIVFP